MIEAKGVVVDSYEGNIVCIKLLPGTQQCTSSSSWLKIGINVALGVFYHFAKIHILGNQNVSSDVASFLFLVAITIWLSNINLEPRCLTLYKPLKWLYDIFAVTIFANFILDSIWKQILLFLNTMVAIAVKYMEESFLSNYIYDWLDPENIICLPDMMALVFVLWVLHSFKLWCLFCKLWSWLVCSVICPITQWFNYKTDNYPCR